MLGGNLDEGPSCHKSSLEQSNKGRKGEKGAELGRPKAQKPENWDSVIAEMKAGNITATKAMEMLNMKRTTFYKLLNS